MKVLEEIKQRAKSKNYTIVLPEANLDERVYNACIKILDEGLSKIIVFGKENEFSSVFNNTNCTIIDIENYANLEEFANQFYELRKHKGMTEEDAKKLIKTPTYFAMMLVKNGLADGVVAGAKYSTADTLRPALQIIKTKPGKKMVTGNTLMIKDGVSPLVLGDVSLIEQPDAETLAEIAIANAEFMEKVLQIEPKVAMLSYSTKGSARHEMVDKVVEATKIAQQSRFKIDGEMQADSALDIDTARRKGITSEVGGNANVLIFPDIDAGNIGYKITARLGGYTAIGPIMLNFNKPVNDLSRGCTVDEIVQTVLITKLLV